MSKRNRWIYTTLLTLCIVGFWWFENFYTPAHYSESEPNIASTVFKSELLPSSTTGQVVTHQHYLLSYSEAYEQAEWVAYTLKKSHLTYDDRERPYFIEDPKVKTKSAGWRNYRGSGFDRGHLCPAGDRRFSEYAYNETFYTSNISPQNSAFNAGVWNRLEMKVRQWCKRYGTLYVITGGVLKGHMHEIGDEDVDVPNAFYKIVVKKVGDKFSILAFLMPNEESNAPLSQFVVSVDEIERQTGIDFFENLSNSEKLEQETNTSSWAF
ncbi:MAG: DNA/RNA non-specific endonuclease [Croceivirga sp.]